MNPSRGLAGMPERRAVISVSVPTLWYVKPSLALVLPSTVQTVTWRCLGLLLCPSG